VAGKNAPEQPGGATAVSERPAESALTGWVTIVWDDPVNLMSYVTHVFSAYFGYPEEKATDLMLQVHNNGKAVVSVGSHEQMETDVDAMHGYGLWATLERG
jgi:ATP-dependent Clp protease adaptor protein ClpS